MRHPQLVKWLQEHGDCYVMIEYVKTSFDNNMFDVSLLDPDRYIGGIRAETVEEELAGLCNILAERKIECQN